MQQQMQTGHQPTQASSTNATPPPQISSPPPLQPISANPIKTVPIEQPAIAKVNGTRNLLSPELQVKIALIYFNS